MLCSTDAPELGQLKVTHYSTYSVIDFENFIDVDASSIVFDVEPSSADIKVTNLESGVRFDGLLEVRFASMYTVLCYRKEDTKYIDFCLTEN